ncbi:hypothetical protein CONPUDRAFT_148784 [Coniophora puteana RWD-64-598 SS2]|uniref:Uncharacterized protein n=1 Tax=Coniophora puteana (strain RWD-64-598) TaxID=741705 RepID=A0A5M3N7B3_CONPW|nr:uncharacterized protein CONPUDRAFT_148784 [Coniophora puteana RWD-64-598 SS2]EIW86725.1 hypothetical protein CONPUDRAFT_148784 [Coniophora puteana RWD-64-598 SS2]
MSDAEPINGGERDLACSAGVENTSLNVAAVNIDTASATGDDAAPAAGDDNRSDAPAAAPATGDDDPNDATPAAASFTRHPNDPFYYVETLKRMWAKDAIRKFMDGHLEGYRVARSQTYTRARDYIDTVTNAYFDFVPWRHKVSDPIPDDFDPRVVENLSEVEEAQKAAKIEAMKSSIKNWLDYRIDNNKLVGRPSSKENDVWARVLRQLAGISPSKPKKLSAGQFWSKSHYTTVVKADFDARWDVEKGKLGSKHRSSFREKITAEHFGRLSEEAQRSWATKAKEAHDSEVAQWNASLNAPIDSSPEARQIAIDNAQAFLTPILEHVHNATGFHASVFLGGPEPRKGGRINVITMHQGTSLASVRQKWPAANPTSYKAALRQYLDFLETCFTTKTKAAAALPQTDGAKVPEGLIPLEDADQNADQDTSEPSTLRTPLPPASASPVPVGSNSEAASPAATTPRARSDVTGARSGPAGIDPAALATATTGDAVLSKDNNAQVASTAARPPTNSSGRPKPTQRKKNSPTMSSSDDTVTPAIHEKRKRGRPAHESDEDSAVETDSEHSVDSDRDTPIPRVYNTRRRTRPAHGEATQVSKASTDCVSKDNANSSSDNPTNGQASGGVQTRNPLNTTHAATPADTVVRDDRLQAADATENTGSIDARVGVEGVVKTCPSNLHLLDNAPEWIQNALGYLSAPDDLRAEDRRKVKGGQPGAIGDRQGWTLPDSYRRLLEEYVRLESSSNFSSPQGPAGTLDSKERPTEVPWWIARKRKQGVRPTIKDLDKYLEQWWKWWIQLQPEWRELPMPSGISPSSLPREDGDWTALDKPGINGFLSLMVSLKWGGSETHGASTDPQWLAAVEDIQWVMSCITRSRAR